MGASLSDRILFWLSTILFALAFIIRTGATSNVSWIRDFFSPYELVVYVLVFFGSLAFIYGLLTGRTAHPFRWALVLTLMLTFGYFVWVTGFLL